MRLSHPNRIYQFVPDEFVAAGMKYGRDLADWYASEIGKASRSRGISGPWGAERDPIRLGRSKVGEFACALLFGLNPYDEVRLDFTHPDSGYDICLPSGTRVDVKTTLPPRRLIWPMPANHLYFEKQYDILLSVSIDPKIGRNCWVEGWIEKQRFYEVKFIADGENIGRGLDRGTWFYEKHMLNKMNPLIEWQFESSKNHEPRCQQNTAAHSVGRSGGQP